MILESRQDSDYENLNSSASSMSSDSYSSFSRFSFDALEQPQSSNSNTAENLMPKPHRSSDFAYSTIRSATVPRKTSLNFRDFRLVRQIGADDIDKVYLCQLRSDDNYFYTMKVVDKNVLSLKKKAHRAEMEKKILKMSTSQLT